MNKRFLEAAPPHIKAIALAAWEELMQFKTPQRVFVITIKVNGTRAWVSSCTHPAHGEADGSTGESHLVESGERN